MCRIFRPFRLQPPLVAPTVRLGFNSRTYRRDGSKSHPTLSQGLPTSIGLRLTPAGSPRRQAESSSSSYGLVIHLPMLSTLPYGNAVPFSYEAQVRPRQGLSPCWFNTLAIALATRFHLDGEVQVENLHPHGKTCSTLWRWHQSGHGSTKLIRLLENAVAMAV